MFIDNKDRNGIISQFTELIKPHSSVYFIGIKGTGVCALAELLHNAGLKVSGSDIPEEFYTDKILKELNIPFFEDIDPSRIKNNIDLHVIYPLFLLDFNEP